MKTTRILQRYACVSLCLCLLCAGVTGCIKDEVAETKETTLTLTVSTRSDDPDQNNQEGHNLETNEEMKTLRVIVARHSNNEIIYNWYEDEIADDDFKRTINFSELTITAGETFDFYAIANEAGFLNAGESLDNITSGELVRLESRILNKSYGSNDPIPQTAIALDVPVGESQDQTLDMQLKFVVAKIDLTFTNQSSSSVTLGDVTFSHMNVANTPLFPSTSLPSNGTDLVLGDITVPGSGTYSVVRYVYESRVTNGIEYVLSTSWGDNSLNLTDEGLGTEFARGTKLDIDVTLNAEEMVKLEFLVVPWDGEVSLDVPAFE